MLHGLIPAVTDPGGRPPPRFGRCAGNGTSMRHRPAGGARAASANNANNTINSRSARQSGWAQPMPTVLGTHHQVSYGASNSTARLADHLRKLRKPLRVTRPGRDRQKLCRKFRKPPIIRETSILVHVSRPGKQQPEMPVITDNSRCAAARRGRPARALRTGRALAVAPAFRGGIVAIDAPSKERKCRGRLRA
jgi:hypothetical protein